MKVYNVWAYDNYDNCGPSDLKGSFMNQTNAYGLAALIEERGSSWNKPDFTPGDYFTPYDHVKVIETEIK